MKSTTKADTKAHEKNQETNSGKDANTKAADKLHEQENAKPPAEKDGQTTADPTAEKAKPQTPIKDVANVYKEEPTKEQKIINYVASSTTQNVDLVPLLKSLYPMATHSEPAKYRNQGEAKRLRVMIERMVGEGKITMYDEGWQKLGRNFHEGEQQITNFHTIDSVKIIAVK